MPIPSYAIPVDDTPASNNIPSYATLADNSAPESSWGSAILNAIPGMSPAASILASNPKSIPQAAGTLVKSIPNAIGKLASTGNPFIPSQFKEAAQQIPTPSPQASNDLALAASIMPAAKISEIVPDIAKLGGAGAKELLRKLGNNSFIKNVTGQNVVDATQKFEGAAKDALTDLFGTSKVSPRDELAQNTNDALQQMYGTPDYKNLIGKENQVLSQAVQDAHNKNYQIGSDRFEKTLNENNPVVSPEDAFINPGESAQLNKIMQMDPLLADKIIETTKNPTLRNLHNVQSQMGAMIADKKSVPYSQRDNESINLLDDFRNKIINNISNYAPQYKDDQQFWKNNVIPYYQNSAINNLVRNNIQPSNIGNILSKQELPGRPGQIPGTVNTILQHLTPEQKQYIPLSKLSGSQSNPLIDLNGNINPDNFAKNAQGLTTKNIQQFLTPDLRQKLIGLGQDLKDAKQYDAITNNVQDATGKVDPQKLISNLQAMPTKDLSPNQRLSIQQALSKLGDFADNIDKQKDKTQGIKELLKRTAWVGGILGGIETGRRIL